MKQYKLGDLVRMYSMLPNNSVGTTIFWSQTFILVKAIHPKLLLIWHTQFNFNFWFSSSVNFPKFTRLDFMYEQNNIGYYFNFLIVEQWEILFYFLFQIVSVDDSYAVCMNILCT